MRHGLRVGILVAAAVCVWNAMGIMKPSEKSVAIVTVGPADEALVGRVVAFCMDNTALRTAPVRALACEGNDMQEIAQCAAKDMDEDEFCIIALAWLDEYPEAQGATLPEERAVVINVRTFQTEDVSEEAFARRVERQVMQNLGLFLGMEPCPNPQCVLWAYSTLEELDLKGRNFCPPCLDRVQKKAVEQGIPLIPQSPFNLQ